jgi:hypothetical protein
MASRNTAHEPPLPPRLAATLALVPISVGVFILSLFVIPAADLPAGVSSFLMFLVMLFSYYVPVQWIWWGTVTWTRRRRRGVLATNLLFGLVLVAAFAVTIPEGRWSDATALLLLSLLVTVGGAVALMIINGLCYSPPGREAGRVVPCPECGHDLRGAGACRCPACHRDFTLGELARSYGVAEALGLTTTSEAAALPGEPDS